MNKPEDNKLPDNIWELLHWLKENNCPQQYYKTEIDRFLEFKSREHGIPFAGHFELTPLCNLDCKMCYVHLHKQQMNGASLLTVEQWKGLMLQAKKAGMRQASLSGGECLTYPGFDELYLYLQELGIDISVYTNGLLLNEERIAFFSEYPPIRIQISLYGSNNDVYEEVTGKRSFDLVAHNITQGLNAKLPICVSVTPSKFIDRDIENILRYLHSINAPYIINRALFTPRENTGRDGDVMDLTNQRYVEIFAFDNRLNKIDIKPTKDLYLPRVGSDKTSTNNKGIQCGAGRSSFAISWDGVMHPCGQFQRIKQYPLVNNFSDCWQNLNHWATNYPRIAECEECAYANICSYCVAYFENYVKPGKRCDVWCQRVKMLVNQGVNHIDVCD